MKIDNSKITELFQNENRLKKLFLLEKEKRGVKNNQPVFLAMANIATHHWCLKKAYFEINKNEESIFRTCLQDRITYAYMLEHIDGLPRSNNKVLEIGTDIVFEEIETLLKAKSKKKMVKKSTSMIHSSPTFDIDSGTIKTSKVNPSSMDPLTRGKYLEDKAELHPTIRWSFDWNGYVVIGEPDGITSSFVYEFKTTRTRSLLKHLKANAITQADLYGHFFKRKNKKIQIYIMDEKIKETWKNKVSKDNAIDALSAIKDIDDGWEPAIPKTWKCNSCHYKDRC